VVAEKLGIPDKGAAHRLVEQRRSDPDANASPVCDWYSNKLEHLALLEFDRDRKSMSVICRQTPHTRHSGEGQLHQAATPHSSLSTDKQIKGQSGWTVACLSVTGLVLSPCWSCGV
jgi:Ca2+-transporting ATPase